MSGPDALSEFKILRRFAFSLFVAPTLLCVTISMGMKNRCATQGWQRQAAILGAVLVLLSGGLCVFGVGHAMADDLSPDLCVSMFAVTLTVLLLSGPFMSGRALCEFWFRLSIAPLRSLDRPPKLAPLS